MDDRAERELLGELDGWMEQNREGMKRAVARLVKIRSVRQPPEDGKPFGPGPAAALDEALAMAAQIGLETRNDGYYYGIAALRGRGEKRLGLFAHLDVVPEGSGWAEAEPYECAEKDGWLIGRGTSDNKGPAVAALWTLKFLKERGAPLEKTVELFFGCAEESGMEDVAYYRGRNTPPDFSLVPDVAFPVCYGEKGLLEVRAAVPLRCPCVAGLSGGLASNIVAPEARAVLLRPDEQAVAALSGLEGVALEREGDALAVRAAGVSRHAAFPEGSVNAIALLCGALAGVEQLGGEARRVFAFVAGCLRDYHGASLGIPYEDEESGKLTHTCGLLWLEDGELGLDFNVRYPIHAPEEEMKRRLRAHLEGAGFRVTGMAGSAPAYFPPDSPQVRALCGVCGEVLGARLEPYTMGGGTYARKLPDAVGFGPGRSDLPARYGGGTSRTNACA